MKVDHAFVKTIVDEPSSTTLASTMVTLAHSLRMKVVAEGLETDAQAKLLQELHCDKCRALPSASHCLAN